PLAESVFAYIDELSATSVEGYAQEQSLRAGEADRRRRELLALLLSGTADPPALGVAAGQAGWAVPEQVVVVLLAPGRAEGLSVRLGRTALVGLDGDLVVAVLPAPADGPARERLDARPRGRQAVVSPVRPVAAVGQALALARAARPLADAGLPRTDPLHVEEHLVPMLLRSAPDLVAQLCATRLAPLAGVRDSARDRLAETLLAWLQHRGERQRVAADLHVHPQTVGYRLGQLRELFGEALDDPEGRFELELALRARAG
ncbi:MAG: PucR family transcriptional regulator, partial [Mycobacteriales bacterium]